MKAPPLDSLDTEQIDLAPAPPEKREELDSPVRPIKIGNLEFTPPVFPAPMCGISDRAWRQFAREQGCPLVYTQMVSSEAMVRGGKEKSWQLLDMFVEPGPVCAQLFGGDPDHLAETAKRLQDAGATIIDLNMGCPVNKIVRSNGGSALMTQPDLVRRIFQKVRAALHVPFTVKFRAGWETFGEEAFTVARLAEEEGLDAVAIHARTRLQGYKGNADWSIIRALKERVKLPVIGNGDVRTANDAVRMVRDYGADGVMIGRGCMGNPWIFGEICARFLGLPDPPEPSVDDRLDAVLRHAGMMVLRRGENFGLREFRKHVVAYMKAFPHAKDLKQQLLQAVTLEEYHDIINRGRDVIHAREAEVRQRRAEELSHDPDDPALFHMGSCQDC